MIKKYDEFVNEALTKNDIYPYMFKGVLEVLNNHREDPEYMKIKKDDGNVTMTISSVVDKPLNELQNDVTFFILPDNFKPNVGIGLETGSYKRNTGVEKFQFFRDGKISDMAKDFYNLFKNENEFNDISSIYLIVKY
jgi:hypothetical protein